MMMLISDNSRIRWTVTSAPVTLASSSPTTSTGDSGKDDDDCSINVSGPILSISRNVRMSVCVFVCPSHFLTTFFAPPSRSPMSKKFRFLESLGKRNGAKWSQISNFLLIKGVKLLRQKNFLTRPR